MNRWLLLFACILLLPAASALQEELQVATCSEASCSVPELNNYNNVSGMAVPRSGGGQQDTDITAFGGGSDSTITGVSAYFSHGGQGLITGSWTVDFRNATDGTIWCSSSTAHSTSFVQVTLTPTGCNWNPERLANLNIQYTNGDGGSPNTAEIDFINLTVNFTLPPVVNSLERYTYVNHTDAIIAWNTNLDTNSTVEWGETVVLGNTILNATLAKNHTAQITGLQKNTQYFYNLTSCDAYSCDTTGPFNFTTYWTLQADACTGLSCTPQEIREYDNESGATYSSSSPYTVNFTQLPDENATIQRVIYRTNTNGSSENLTFSNNDTGQVWCTDSKTVAGYTEQEPSGCSWTDGRVNSLQINHSITIPGTIGIDFSALLVQYILAPRISLIQENDLTTDSVRISWNTDNAANSTIEWGETLALSSTQTDAALNHSRSFTLSGLNDNTTHYYNVTSCTADACETQGPFTFTTLEVIPPEIENVRITDRNETAVRIAWDTVDPANASIEWGLTKALGTDQGRSTLLTNHNFTMSGLSPGTRYYYRIESCDAEGCTSQPTRIFVTAPSPSYCTYRYEEQGPQWTDGMISDGDVVVLECLLPGQIGESEDLTLRAIYGAVTDQVFLTTPRLLARFEEVIYP